MTEAQARQAEIAMTARNNVEALRARIVQRYEALSPRLKQVAAYTLEHPNDIGLETLAVIAKRCKVQPSTIVRFAKTFGYDGASDMQKLFRDELLSHAPSPSYAERIRQFNERAGDTAARSPSELMHGFVQGNIAALQHLDETTRQDDLERGVRMIAEAEAVYLVGPAPLVPGRRLPRLRAPPHGQAHLPRGRAGRHDGGTELDDATRGSPDCDQLQALRAADRRHRRRRGGPQAQG